MISLQNVNKYYNRFKSNQIHVINDTTLELPDTGIVTILGPSGCGKTTLLNAIGGLDKINSGKIFVDGDRITGVLSGRKDKIRNAKIGYIFQNYNLLDNLTVYENVAIALRMVGVKDKKIIEERVKYCLEAVGIYQYRNKNADSLSGGQRQRVAIARAIVKNPKIIIADEPTGNLDSINTLEVMNIIKTISRDRLVLLVTHERKLAEFYAERIIEMKDGKIISDEPNDSSKHLDYQLENRIYLKDMPVVDRFKKDEIAVDVYSDEDREANIKLVLRGGNLYINTGGRFNIVDEGANIEMIDDHYSMIDQSIYEDHAFKYDEHMPPDFKAKYRSLYTPWNMISQGFRTVAGFKLLKKLLLIGFVFAAMFMTLAVSNVFGILDIKEKDFLTTNNHYLTVSNPQKSADLIHEIENIDGVRYALPGNSIIQVQIPLGDYYQTANANLTLNGSLVMTSTIGSDDIVFGRMPEKQHEIAIDRMLIDKFLNAKAGQQAGILRHEQFLDRTVKVPNLEDFTVVGISDTNSPSLYFDDDQYMFVLTNARPGESDYEFNPDMLQWGEYEEGIIEESEQILDYKLAPDSLEIRRGDPPAEPFDAIVNYNHYEEEEFTIGRPISIKMANQRLNLVGFYSDNSKSDTIYVTSETILQNFAQDKKVISVYADDVDMVNAELESMGLSVKINYNRDKAAYKKRMSSVTRSGLIVAGIILLIALIEMFLMLRSSFLSRIKEVGTLRAIGLRKRDIYMMFTGEILVISVITAVPGIAIMYYVLTNIVKITDFIAGNYIVEPIIAAIAFVMILVFNLVAGLLPVFRTLRKTPAAILARTDI